MGFTLSGDLKILTPGGSEIKLQVPHKKPVPIDETLWEGLRNAVLNPAADHFKAQVTDPLPSQETDDGQKSPSGDHHQ